MSVAEHLGIETSEYDAQILTFIPHYDEILDNAAAALDALERPGQVIVDLGTGSGALAARCLRRLRGARVIGIDTDARMLEMAHRRLGRRLSTVVANFESAPIPRCDVVTASFSLHHITTPAAKARVFRRAWRSLAPGGMLIDADCATAASPRLRRKDLAAWHAHLAVAHGKAGATKFLNAWADEDTYFTLDQETSLLHDADFRVDVVWRRGAFAVIAAVKASRSVRRTAARRP